MVHKLIRLIRTVYTFLLILLFSFPMSAQQKSGVISGEIRDASTQQPLPAASISLLGTSYGAASDNRGRFVIRDIEPGTYQARVSYIGYRTFSLTDVIVAQARNTTVQVELQPTEVQMSEVSVNGGYFQKPLENAVSIRSLTSQEIRRSPGSAEDIFRVMQSLPGVATAGGKSAQLIVRGGSPDENLTLLDHIEIYNPIHFARTGESMGIISIINPSLLRSVDFLTGGFPAMYGDKMSSVFEMSLVDGNKELTNVDLNLNLAGFGALVDGPTFGGGSMVFSARRGFFDLLTSLMNKPAAPQYYDFVGKVTYDLDARNRVSLVGFYYLDKITRTGATKESTAMSKYTNVNRDDYGSAAGVNWRFLLSNKLYTLTTLSFSGNGWNTLQGTASDPSLSGEDILEDSYSLKNQTVLQLSSALEIKAGLQVQWIDSRHTAWQPADTTRRGEIVPASSIAYFPGVTNKLALFLQDTWKPLPNMSMTTGLRYDVFSFTKEATWSPRLGVSYYLTERVSLNASYGSFYQTPAAYQIALDPANQLLKSSLATHAIFGIEYLANEDLRATIEIYQKNLTSVVVSNDTTNLLTNAGSGRAQGIEFSIQKKYTSGFVGSASYSYSFSQRQDGAGLPSYDFEYDRPHIINLIAGWEAGNNWQIGFKWQFASGNPYTPVVGTIKKGGIFYVIDGARNSARYPDYHKLDIRIDKKFIFSSFTLTAYLDLWNIYNRTNVLSYTYKTDASGVITQNERLDFGLLPILGLTAQF
jgi:outer membrane receptor protein involved in Fe transport